jgi:hypothetical protein
MKQILLLASIAIVGWSPGCGPDAEIEKLQAQGVTCASLSSLAHTDGAVEARPVAESMEACDQHVSLMNTAETPASEQ